jgi:hypothetical protein
MARKVKFGQHAERRGGDERESEGVRPVPVGGREWSR